MQQPGSRASLWSAVQHAPDQHNRFLWGASASVSLGNLAEGSALGGRSEELRGRSVLVATADQFTAALALIELDGIARRLILCPPDFPPQHLSFVIEAAGVDAVVFDRGTAGLTGQAVPSAVECSPTIAPGQTDRSVSCQTEWVLLTSGTTGLPKLTVHTLDSLAGAIRPSSISGQPVVWSTFYDIRRYGGLQIFLRAVLTSASLVLSNAQEATADHLARAGEHGVTHFSGTPTHWRRELMSPAARLIAPRYVRSSGEIADQALLDHLRSFYPKALVAHAFASTEAGLVFEVNDGLAGFPAEFIGRPPAGVEIKVEDGSLRIRSNRTATRYLGRENNSLKDADGFVDTGDMLELSGGRYYFAGRRDGVINVGGLKVHPEEVEAVINRHPQVRMSLVRTRKNPITGAIVVADIVLEEAPENTNGRIDALKLELLHLCRNELPPHKVPASINFVPTLTVAATGKLARYHA